ncbi:hypothetical protein IEN85_19005 [Pelagicoccus sp. NFK12]|uniref:Uncharacterized protein n=1 Tax=Pelagicoccus enzymogenes TaxID=2773457 RepID=A0A927FB40_9BACT|nr:hypothetical protein [Pelagicoccus enzymogenes]MBD5781599.1 hypothetical protein [Pelagicoccus enzymogenes]MDQ8200060.1 hypothetical protein [Pelagicoccus enzymogenes]
MTHQFLATSFLTAGLLLAGCADSPYDDVHDAPRETQAWENVDLSGYEQSQLLAHLNMLASETVSAASAGEYVEFHHLEVALTPTLDALAIKAAGNEQALKTIATIKDLAVKLHVAGHDGNVGAGVKLGAAITDLSARLTTEL